MNLPFFIIGLLFIGTGVFLAPVTQFVISAWLVSGVGVYLVMVSSILHVCDRRSDSDGR